MLTATGVYYVSIALQWLVRFFAIQLIATGVIAFENVVEGEKAAARAQPFEDQGQP